MRWLTTHRRWLLGVVLLLTGMLAALAFVNRQAGEPRIIATLPHDPNAYTQGLLLHQDWFYESTGQYGHSSLRRVEPGTGKVLQKINLPATLFGEGLALVDDRLIQLTWRSGQAFVYDLTSFELLQEFRYDTEGWGLTYDGTELIMSDGSHLLYFRDPHSFALLRTLPVFDKGQPVRYLNELEYIRGEVWANVYRSPDIVRIDPGTGQVIDRLRFPELPRPDERNGHEDVLNGIAYDASDNRLYITGKLYSYVYELNLAGIKFHRN